jgi:lysozyme
MTMTTSAAGRAAIKQREGVRLKAYRDSVGVLTIGVGHTSAAGNPTVSPGMTISAVQADEILARDLGKFEKYVDDAISVPMEQHEFDAMVSLCFNIGPGNFAKSSVVREFNAGDKPAAADAFLMWNKAGGKVLQGLVTRRKSERAQFLGQ